MVNSAGSRVTTRGVFSYCAGNFILSFLLQGPYRTTPSRDNVPQADLWNKRLVRQTALLLVQTLRWFRDNSLLGLDVLRCLPLDQK